MNGTPGGILSVFNGAVRYWDLPINCADSLRFTSDRPARKRKRGRVQQETSNKGNDPRSARGLTKSEGAGDRAARHSVQPLVWRTTRPCKRDHESSSSKRILTSRTSYHVNGMTFQHQGL